MWKWLDLREFFPSLVEVKLRGPHLVPCQIRYLGHTMRQRQLFSWQLHFDDAELQ